MLEVQYTTKFKKDLQKVYKRGYDIALFETVVSLLQEEKPLDPKYKEHSLKGKYSDCSECHITPDWLLIYKVDKQDLVLIMTRTGTHSDLF